MIVIPAIDIIDGKPVRLYQGDYNKKKIVGEDVLEISKKFEREGADYIHIVDLDGAKAGRLINKEIILKLAKTLKIPIEVGGGIRTYEDIKYLIEAGVSRVILGTIAIEDKALLRKALEDFGDKIAVGIDCKDGYVCTRGWLSQSKRKYIDFLLEMEKMGVKNIIVTDISKDGTLQGSNIEMIKEIKEISKIDITASGGVKDIEDIRKLKELDIYGVIAGKSIYSKTLSLKEALELTK
ncbi:1-(5-phosphoribosyl)-5-[(5-phosphoribosylamino)methylideneamino]imidazole-4-carboxamide isomerase [Clostridium isatidis]|mgnify:CR=1 FL=1|jgi:phosphoribosylformimino-5-aminoimidazole carboxamide ribotide isomerase|uniref:1-(5-phosphoribosyl)-5-[(5-phosphoribosylamino)methylideneamino] imidazole-4-carboxamide isomerase n=1 Tax=Clostridium isatidis TaxID=182773 RepID=A0A343JE34_9CLOT|nr:1-(5-phosphoribosyl)-5-[(5-phosphoribosylamino)methylideneamino]imidazole-4-carboxamide isomerase [Clostridium isatidis]ASW43792.1 1-(5-phosphoribosyl)-5-[(5-phosphoribosylamino)methylideneamino]imidazole-4-carboxamide isomerase [Clostridium isatidis]NLL31638.1 1-(5-phosphoribosyl)-5-[(5-phosphoribosylamino)methylideneamino]imidazole-4-carboxamide isomerase [Clostridiales bacterium]NLZ35205.1 1-(5-phosphoribosyl)-5-[(5-phosphoribosylamino)methylideneamino]imidazole-4-carboxamide isomerase [Cl